MFYTIVDDLILYQLLSFVKKYSNFELKLYNYFYQKTDGIFPEFILVINKYVLFFVKNENFFTSCKYLNSMRRELKKKKILIIRAEKILINLVFSLFPDLNIKNIKVEMDNNSGIRVLSIYFLFYEERGLAIGHNGDYIKVINEIFKKYIVFENRNTPLEVKCKFKE